MCVISNVVKVNGPTVKTSPSRTVLKS